MSIGKIIAGILVCACVGLIFVFTLKSLLKGDQLFNTSAASTEATETVETTEESSSESEPTVTPATEEVSTEENVAEASTEPSTEASTEMPDLDGFNPDSQYVDTMGDGTIPEKKEDYVVESTHDFKQFWDNGKENYLAFKNFIIKKTHKNTTDMVCDYFVDIAFKDGSSLEGLRCNDVTGLQEGNRFRYGYVRDDATQQNGQNVMYLYLVQE